MLANVFTKAIRDRWLVMAIAACVLVLFLLYGMSVYRSVDLTLYTDMPDQIKELFGFGSATDASSLAYGAIYSFMGALTLAGIAIAMGASAIAGEERNGTIGLLLANPTSRTSVLLSKAASLVLLTAGGALVLWAGGRLVPIVLNVDAGGVEVGALAVHMFANALFYGFLALAIGAWTGNGSAASGLTAAVMTVSYVTAGILPLVESLAEFARIVPWYYYDSSDPVFNGIDWSHLAVLLVASAVFAGVAVVGVNRRDLTERAVGDSITDRLRTHPLTRAVVERLEGSARVSAIWLKTTSEHQGLLIVTALVIFALAAVIGPLYTLLDDELKDFSEQLPDALLALVGDADLATPEGFYQTENFSLTLPIAMMLVAVAIGSRALAGEEQRRTMGLLLANPIPRSRVVLEKSGAMLLYASVLGIVTFLGTVLGSELAGLGMSNANIAATSLLLTLLGLVFGACSLVLSAGTGSVRIATYGTAGLALGLYLWNSFLPLTESLAGLARLSPFHYYLDSNPLTNGMAWLDAGLLAALTAILVGASVWLFDQRDLR